jgi:uncharacterized membrane protein
VLPVIGLFERYGLQERARMLIGNIRAATTGRPLLAYFMLGQLCATVDLTSIGGHAQAVRPLIAPMAANINIVPAALLELPDRDAVIKVQLPTAVLLLLANTLLMYLLVFRFGAHPR